MDLKLGLRLLEDFFLMPCLKMCSRFHELCSLIMLNFSSYHGINESVIETFYFFFVCILASGLSTYSIHLNWTNFANYGVEFQLLVLVVRVDRKSVV